MKPEIIQELIKQILLHHFPQLYQNAWVQEIADDPLFQVVLYQLTNEGPFVLQSEDLHLQTYHFRALLEILKKSLFFSQDPIRCTYFDVEKLKKYSNMATALANLPTMDYLRRPTAFLKDEADEDFLIYKSILASNLEALIQIEPKNKDLWQEWERIKKLTLISIPDRFGESHRYCILDETVGGVTEKIALIELEELNKKLAKLISFDSYQTYQRKKKELNLQPTAILKLPKHGEITKVQREALALNISRILGLETTDSNMVNYQGKPALFISFEHIQLLNEFANGEAQLAFLPSSFWFKDLKKIGSTYLHYSTILPIGNGLNADSLLCDFGKALGFSYLCNDPDFIGTHNQNKAIKEGKIFYVFDQVFQDKQNLDLDSRLSLLPVGIGRIFRHNMGRNRSIVEDSFFDSKFSSIVELLAREETIVFLLELEQINYDYCIQALESPKMNSTLSDLQILKEDLKECKTILHSRMSSLFTHFPKLNNKPMSKELFLQNQSLIRQCLIFEKLLNKPKLFASDGRPYRHPWTDRNHNHLLSIEEKNFIWLTFKQPDEQQIYFIIKKAKLKGCVLKLNRQTLLIPKEEMAKLTEDILFTRDDPLELQDLIVIQSAYPNCTNTSAIPVINKYLSDLNHMDNYQAKVDIIKKTLIEIQDIETKETVKGFLKHAELILQFDAYFHLSNILLQLDLQSPSEIELALTNALQAAIKLDRLDDFNRVLIEFISNPKEEALFFSYLQDCHAHDKRAKNYNQGRIESKEMHKDSLLLLKKLAPSSHYSVNIIESFSEKNEPLYQDWTEIHSDPTLNGSSSDGEDEFNFSSSPNFY